MEGRQGCEATAELFPDTGYAGRRNVYQQTSGAITVLGQYDAGWWTRTAVPFAWWEFQSLVGQATYLGTFDIDTQKRWQFLSPSVKIGAGRLKSRNREPCCSSRHVTPSAAL